MSEATRGNGRRSGGEATRALAYDVAIVGGGPAGLSASLWLARYLHRVVLVDSGDPRNWETRGINGFLGQPGVRPAELRGMGATRRGAAASSSWTRVCERVRQLDEDCFELMLADGTPTDARRLLLAIGLRDVWPDIPGLEHVYGANAHVCPDCDGYECAGEEGRGDRQGPEGGGHGAQPHHLDDATSSSARTASRPTSTSTSTARSSTR